MLERHAVIKTVSVVAMTELLDLRQDHNEPVRRFCARAAAQARNCNMTMGCSLEACTAKVDITNIILKHVVIKGLSDPDIRRDNLRTPDLDDKSLTETLAIIEVGETASRALVDPSEAGQVGNPGRDSRSQGHRDYRPTATDDK
jgi:hypothetical protein